MTLLIAAWIIAVWTLTGFLLALPLCRAAAKQSEVPGRRAEAWEDAA